MLHIVLIKKSNTVLIQVFKDKDIAAIYKNSCYGASKVKDSYLVSQLTSLTLTLLEHNFLKWHDVINERGIPYRKWALPASYSRNNKERVIESPESYIEVLERYLEWYVNQNLPSKYRHNLNTYRGLSDQAPLLLNDQLSAYAMNKREVSNGISYQPTNLRNKVKTLLNKAGLDWATAKTFEDSLVIKLASSVDHNSVKKAFGYSSKQVVTDKFNGNLETLEEALNKIYSGIKVTGH